MYATKDYRDTSFPKLLSYYISTWGKSSHCSYPYKVRLCIKIYILNIIIYNAHFKTVISKTGNGGKTQLRDRVFTPLTFIPIKVFFMGRVNQCKFIFHSSITSICDLDTKEQS